MKMAARFSTSPSRKRPSAQTIAPGHGVSDVNVMRSALCACWTPAARRLSRIICSNVWPYGGAGLLDLQRIDQLVVLVHAERAVRAEALDGERPGDADGLGIDVRAVVEELELRLGSDRRVDRLLPGDARFPEVGERLLRGLRPVRRRLARDLPFDQLPTPKRPRRSAS